MFRNPHTDPWHEPGPKPETRQSGFVLLEVLIATVLAALTLIVVFHAYTTAFGGSERTERVTVALLAAESKLAELGVATTLRPGATAGRLDGGYRWRADVRPYGGLPEAEFGGPPVVAYEVEVTVSWGGGAGQAVTLSSLRLVAKDRHGRAR